MVVRKLQVKDSQLPGEYVWSAGKYNGKFTVGMNTGDSVCIRIPGGLSQMPDLATGEIAGSNRRTYASTPYTGATAITSGRRHVPGPGPASNTDFASSVRSLSRNEGEIAEFYRAGRTSEPIYVASPRPIYAGPSMISSEGGTISAGGFGSVYNTTAPYYSGSGISGGFLFSGNNGYIGGSFYPQPYYYPVNHPNGVLYSGIIGGVYPRYPRGHHRSHYNRSRYMRGITPRRITTGTSLNGPTIQISNPMTR
jgi:hypothetical protein